MVDIPPQQTWNGRRRPEQHLIASIIPARQARLTLAADNVGLHGHALADFVSGYGRVLCDDDACGFVTEDMRVFDDHGTYAAGMPEVDIGAMCTISVVVTMIRNVAPCLPANTGTLDRNSYLARLQTLALLNLLFGWNGVRNPKVMLWVRVHADVRLGWRNCRGGGCRHLFLFLAARSVAEH